jgi:hypothetical protein
MESSSNMEQTTCNESYLQNLFTFRDSLIPYIHAYHNRLIKGENYREQLISRAVDVLNEHPTLVKYIHESVEVIERDGVEIWYDKTNTNLMGNLMDSVEMQHFIMDKINKFMSDASLMKLK